MSMSQAAREHQAKIQAAKRECEIHDGKRIDPAKIKEWALLEICSQPSAIHFMMVQSNVPKLNIKGR